MSGWDFFFRCVNEYKSHWRRSDISDTNIVSRFDLQSQLRWSDSMINEEHVCKHSTMTRKTGFSESVLVSLQVSSFCKKNVEQSSKEAKMPNVSNVTGTTFSRDLEKNLVIVIFEYVFLYYSTNRWNESNIPPTPHPHLALSTWTKTSKFAVRWKPNTLK